ncbi:hypothetical protein [Enterocloster bolteae]|uniref:hypothetical protein n=1 Tax=Enterocloster bolteae TaxID=208479 RepID=UPI002A83F68E|nr:hypothetical protein [Enterocloster bolteae]
MRKAFKILAVTTLALTLTLPFTAYAGTWQQDSTGWKVLQDNGTYLTNAWYQSESGLFYYIGADGYMMVNAITPDGYQVGEDGAWIQPQATQPEVQPTQPQQSETHYEAGTTMKDANGNEVHKGKLSDSQSLSPEENAAINEIQFN